MFKSSLKYLGFIFNLEGISPDPEKVKSIKEASPPTNPTEVRSFMGIVTFCGRFIPGLAVLSEPLLQLTHKDTKWQWCDVMFSRKHLRALRMPSLSQLWPIMILANQQQS
jgi:hypothetical protein